MASASPTRSPIPFNPLTGAFEAELARRWRSSDWSYDVFISHSGEDKLLAHTLRDIFGRLGLEAFVDTPNPRDIAFGGILAVDRIAPVGVAILSQAYLRSEWPMRELLMLVGQGTFLPVLHGVTRKEAIDQFVNSPQAAKHEPSEWTSLVLTFKHTTSISVGAGSQALERQFVEQIVHSTVRLCVTSVSTQIRGHALNSIWAGRFIKKLEAAAREMSKTFDYIPRSAAKDAQAWADEMKSFTKGSSRSPDGGAHPTSSSDTSVLRVGEPVPAGHGSLTPAGRDAEPMAVPIGHPTPGGSTKMEASPLLQPALSKRPGGDLPRALRLALAKLMAAASSIWGDADLSGLRLGYFPLDKFSDLTVLIKGLRSLNLSKTALVELPAAMGSLSNLQKLILEGNKLAALPVELDQLKNLKVLDVRNNHLSEVPACVKGMVALKTVRLDDNVGIGSVPDWLPESCPGVTELSVEACGLSSFPPALGRLGVLKKLNLSRNMGMILPTSLADEESGGLLSKGLEELSLCSLGLEDDDIACLRPLKRLKRVNLRNNALVSLPPFVVELPDLVELELRDNQRLVTPPPEVVQHGLVSVKEYMAALNAGSVTTRTIVRVMFVGWASAGKTKLNYALQGRLPEWDEGSTIGIDTAKWAPDWAGKNSEDCEFRSWDFAGQEEYYAMHRIFLTERAIYLLLVDVSEPPPDPEGDPENARFRSELRRTVRFWLESLTKSTKKAIVRVVATKVDLLELEVVEARVQVLLEELAEEERACRADLEASALGEDGREMAREALANRPSLPTGRGDIFLSSLPQAPCKRTVQQLDDETADELLPRFEESWGPLDAETSHQPDFEHVMEDVLRPNGKLPAQEMASGLFGEYRGHAAASSNVSRSEECLSCIRDVLLELATEARFRIELPRSYVELMAAVEKRKRALSAFPYMDYEAFRTEMLAPAGLVSEGGAETATQLLHDLGIVLWFNRSERYADGQQAQVRRSWGGLAQRVFLDPQWVVDLLKPILGHQLEHQFQPIPDAQEKWGLYWRERFKSRGEAEEHREYLLRLLEHSGTLNHGLLDLIPGAEASAGYLHSGPTFQSPEEAGRYKKNLLRQLSERGHIFEKGLTRLIDHLEHSTGGDAPSIRSEERAEGHTGDLIQQLLKRVDSLRQGLLHLTPGPSTPGPSLQSNVLDLLERYRLAYPVDRGAHFIPTRCKDDPPANLFKELFPASAVPASAQLDGIRLTFCGTDPSKLARLPGGFVESVIVSLHSLLSKNFQGERGEGPPGVTHQWRQGTLFQGVLYPERASNSGALSHLKLAILVHVPPGTESLELLWMVRPAEAADSEIGPPASESPTFHGWHVFRGFCLDSIAPIAEKVSLFARPSLEVLVPASLPLDPPRESSFKTTHGAAPKPFQHNPAYHWQPPLAYKGWKKALPDHRPEWMRRDEWTIVPAHEGLLRDFSSLLPTEPNVSAVVYKLPRGLPILFGSIFKKLSHLDISGASVVALPYDLAEHTPALSTLNAGFNELESVEKCRLPGQLRVFFLHGNKLSGASPNLLELPTLEIINLDNNRLTTFGLPRGIDLRHVTSLNLNGNRISGLPPAISRLQNLTALSLKKNRLVQLPDSIGSLSKLEVLHVSSNLLTSLPGSLGALTALRVLNVARNHLSGLPPSIGGLVSLVQLRVEEQGPGELVELALGGDVGTADRMDQAIEAEADLDKTGPGAKRAGERMGQHGKKVRASATLEFDEALGLGPGSPRSPLPQIVEGRAPGQDPWSGQGGDGVPLTSEQRVFGPGLEFKDRAFFLPDVITGGSLERLELLSCFRNRLEALPGWACRLQALKELNLNDNLLERLPRVAPEGGLELGLPALERLLLENNRLTELPAWLEKSPHCRTLVVAENDLMELPAAIGHMASLEVLDLAGNNKLLFPEPATVRQGIAAIQLACRDGRTRPTTKSTVRQIWERPYGLLAVLMLFVALFLVRGVGAALDRVDELSSADGLRDALTSPVWGGVIFGVVLALSFLAVFAVATWMSAGALTRPVGWGAGSPVATGASAALAVPAGGTLTSAAVGSTVPVAGAAVLPIGTAAATVGGATAASGLATPALGLSTPVSQTAATPPVGLSTAPLAAGGTAAPVAGGSGPLIGKGLATVADVSGASPGRPPTPPWEIRLQSRICEDLTKRLPKWESATSCWPFGDSSTAIMPRGVGEPEKPTELFGKEPITQGFLGLCPEVVVYADHSRPHDPQRRIGVMLNVTAQHHMLEDTEKKHFGYYQEKIVIFMEPSPDHRESVSVAAYEPSSDQEKLVVDEQAQPGKGWEAGFNPAVDATIAGAVTLRGFLPSFKVTKPSKPGLQIKGREVKLITTNYRGDIGAEKHAWEITLNHQGSGPSGEAIPHQASKKFFDKATKCLRAPTLGPTVSEYSNRFLGTWNFNDISVVEVSIDVQIKRYFRLVRVNEKNKLEEPEWVPVYRKSIRVKCEETSNP